MLALQGDFDNSMFDMSSYVTRNMPDFGLVNLPWSWGDRGGGGGGSMGNPFDAMNECLKDSHPNGGSWSSTSGLVFYESQNQAFISGCLTNQLYGYWGRAGAAGSWGEAYSKYSMSASIDVHRSSEMIELDCQLNSLKQYFAIVAGETGTGEEEAAGIGSVIMNILRLKCWSVFDVNFTSEIGGKTYFNAINDEIYNKIMSDSWDDIFSSEYKFSSRIYGALDALISGKDYSYGAYFFNATYQNFHPEKYKDCDIGANWRAYRDGIFVITQVIGKTTFFRYDYKKHKQQWR